MSKSCHSNHSLEKVYSSRTCHIFPCMDLTCLEHYTEEGDSRVYDAQAAWTGTGLVGKSMGDRTGNKSKKGKPAAPRMSSSLSTSGCQVSTSAMG